MSVDLSDQATLFAADLTDTVRIIAPECAEFKSAIIDVPNERARIAQALDTGIPLKIGEEQVLTLKVIYNCCLDRAGRYLAVDASYLDVYQGQVAQGEPLVHYDYMRMVNSNIASAHIQFNAHRDEFTHLLANPGRSTSRARRRSKSGTIQRIADVHFPVGGHRFRPCLEDVLEMLVDELGVECDESGRSALREGRRSPQGTLNALRNCR